MLKADIVALWASRLIPRDSSTPGLVARAGLDPLNVPEHPYGGQRGTFAAWLGPFSAADAQASASRSAAMNRAFCAGVP